MDNKPSKAKTVKQFSNITYGFFVVNKGLDMCFIPSPYTEVMVTVDHKY